MAYKVGMVSLGCAKNQVDGEVLMASLEKAGFQPVDDAAMADIAIVNTCGFIESAKKESIEEILELAQLKKEGKIKKLVVTGCLGERYQAEMHKELPELDAVIGIGANGDIAQLLTQMMEEDQYVESFPDKSNMPLCGERVLTTPSYFAYVKIAEGCDKPVLLLRHPPYPGRVPQPHHGEHRGGVPRPGGRRRQGAYPHRPGHLPLRHRLVRGVLPGQADAPPVRY